MRKIISVLLCSLFALQFLSGYSYSNDNNIPETLLKTYDKCFTNSSCDVYYADVNCKTPLIYHKYYKDSETFRVDCFTGTTDEVIDITRPGERVIYHSNTKMIEKYGSGAIPAIKLIKDNKVEETDSGENTTYKFEYLACKIKWTCEITIDKQKMLLIGETFYDMDGKLKNTHTYKNWKFEKFNEKLLDYKFSPSKK